MVSYFEKGLRGTIIVFIFTVLAYLSGYLTRLFLARAISTEEFGLFYSVFTLFLFIVVFTDMGFSQAAVKYIPEFIAKKKKALVGKTISYFAAVNVILGLVAATLLLLMSSFLSTYYFKTSSVAPLIVFFALIIILNTFSGIFQTVFQAFQDMFSYGLLSFLNKFLFFVICILLFYLGAFKGVFLPGIAYFLTIALLVIIFAVPFYRKIKSFKLEKAESKSQGFNKILFSKMSRFAFPNLLTVIAGTFIGYIDTLILTYMVSLSMVGVYNAVLPTVLILSQLGGVIATVFFPMLSELWAKKDHARMQNGISMIYRYCLLLTLPFCFAALFFATPILRILFGVDFVIGATALRILSLGMILLTLAQVNFSVLNGIGKPKEVTKIVVFAAAFNTVLNLVLIPLMGISGAALTTTLSYLIMLAWSYISMRKNIQFKAEKSLSIVISSFIFLGLLYLFKQVFSLTRAGMSLYLEAVISLAVSFLVYAALAFLLKCITFGELKRILRNAMRLRSSAPASVPSKD